ncbi:MAG: hypothetical protein AUJ72_01990 [Candidatus Omnitrophica bacterium CG1_02_46_14]|nr:MAG: hypothetical protein AUJ72_01990 [Candidatus Omnitrophica bacterium CG1_02_46_14]
MVRRLWEKDASLWSRDPHVQEEIRKRLGWLNAPNDMTLQVENINAFAEEIKNAGTTHIVLLGMGGSSLAPEVFQTIFGNRAGYPELVVLDSTDPGRVLDVQNKIKLESTLFVVSSKSGGTIESVSFYKYFFEKVTAVKKEKAGEQFIAITDPGSPLEDSAKKAGFKKIFLAPPDVGGRYSALTFFGLVPAALIGLDIKKLLEKSHEMMRDCSAETPVAKNPAMVLGIAMAVLAEEGRDKFTLLAPKSLESFGDWAEQLVAESSGKEGAGIVPVVREPLGELENYGHDRFFVGLLSGHEQAEEIRKALKTFSAKGHPTLTLVMEGPEDIAGQFFLWEMATAVACALLKINAFDQPDVQSAKDKTKSLLKVIEAKGSLDVKPSETTLEDFFGDLKPCDYIGILAFLPDRPVIKALLTELQTAIRNFAKNAVTLGLGPRYLHSTGQLHKGGPATGAFILITAKTKEDQPVPGEKYSFGQLEFAQAMGDFETLGRKERRVVHLTLQDLSEKSLEGLRESILKAVSVWA